MSSIRLGEIGKISMCKRILKSQTNEFSGIPFYKISTFGGTPTVYIDEKIYREYKEKYSYPKKGDILISAAGTIGKTVIFDGEDSYFQDSNIVWIENDESKVTNQFLYYFLQTNPFITTNGSTIKRLYNDNLRDTKIPNVPSIQQQNQITDILGALDKKIQINNQINQELEAMAKTLYDYWFVQFDFPDQNGKPYKSSGGKMVYNPELKREIPEGWGVETLKDFESKIITGKTPSRANSDNFGGEIPFITIGDIRGNTFIYSTSETLTDLGASVQQNKYLPQGSLCVSCIATVGEIGFTTEWSHTNQQINSIVFEDETNRYYLYFALKNYFENANASAKTGNTFANMNKEDFSGIRIILPRNEIKNNFHKITEPHFAQIKCLQGQNQELTQLRDWLLPMLMNGQVKVENYTD
ncbi:restriction endonuclease subunit S [Streptococcus oralis]|uniref:restriction endonuclease subunit S n=1 Tax=Streptococcus oralis TaxID=1303 RepID=UPI0024952F15|nr:restriction endonuclease subunit S [Streptococcus oralis]